MNNNSDKRKYIPWIFIPCIIAFVLQFLISVFVMEASVVFTIGTFRGSTWDDMISYLIDTIVAASTNGIIYVLYSVVGIILFIICYNKLFMEGRSYKLKGISKNLPATIGGLVLFCVGMQYVSIALMQALGEMFPAWLEEYEQLMESAGLDEEITILMALYAIVLGPIVEEIIFRGLTFSAAKKVMPYYWAIIVQALLFGAFHMNPIQSSYAFILGVGMGYIMYLYDNLIITIIVHFIYNFIGIICSGILPAAGDSLISFFFYTLFALIISYFGILLLRKGAASVKEKEEFSDI